MKMNADDKEIPQKFLGRFAGDKLSFGPYVRAGLRETMKAYPNAPFELKVILPESRKQRGFFEGGICRLIAYYQEGMDHRNYKDVNLVREWLKVEFNGELITIGSKVHRVAKSTKNELNKGFLERITDYIIENYNPPLEAIDTSRYKYWRDRIYPNGGPDTYIDYLIELNLLKST